MTYCQECKDRLWPCDPEVGFTRHGHYIAPLCDYCPHQSDKQQERLEERVANLEEISAMPGEIPREYHDTLQQLQGQIIFVENKLNAALDKGKQRAAQKAKQKETEKPTYRGLSA